jgi:hypothetical protein
MAAERTRGRLLSGKSGTGRRTKRRRAQFPEPVWTGSRSTRVTPARTPADPEAEVAELVEPALRDTPPLDLIHVDDLMSTASL